MTMPSSPNKTFQAACLTPPGTGGIATILVRAPIELISSPSALFVSASAKPLHLQPFQHIIYGKWGREDVVVCRLDADQFEIHCHGGKAATSRILNDLFSCGIESVDPACLERCSKFDQQIFELMTHATTRSQLVLILAQQQLTFPALLEKLISNIIPTHAVLKELRTSLAWTEYGQQRMRAARVILAGPPNVGKSSLINALVGYERVVVHQDAGTTRDLVSATISVEGYPIELCDTAGLRESQDEIETQGIARTRERFNNSDLLLLMIDAENPDESILDIRAMVNVPCLVVVNKTDRADYSSSSVEPDLHISAKLKLGIEKLQQKIVSTLFPVHPPSGTWVPLTSVQSEWLEKLIVAIESSQSEQVLQLVNEINQPREI